MTRRSLAAVVVLLLGINTAAARVIVLDLTSPLDQLADTALVDRAEHYFGEGTIHLDDADAARGWFRAAATGYDELWHRGHHTPALALNRARSHRLAGDLPGAIVALHDGLAVARYDRALQVELEDARSAVAYPHDGELAAECRPRPAGGIATRMSPAEAYLAAGLFWILACLGVARFAMTRTPGWLVLTGVGFICLAVLGGLWWQDWRRTEEESRPLVVVADEAMLKTGNGDSWPDRLRSRLPRGVEARQLARRGGWVQVELAGGAVGWLPESAVLRAGE